MITVLKSVRSRKFLAALSVLAAVAAMLVGARVAVADSIWYQSYQRASASDVCVAQAGETPWQDSWGPNPGWSPSWEQWANNGQGGWVCSRSITWARDSAARIYNLGDTGPGGGLVFYIDSASGLRYEMAPKNWGVSGAIDPQSLWTTSAAKCYGAGLTVANQDCQYYNLYSGTIGTQTANSTASEAIGMGSVNTAAIKARMVAGSVSSSDYAAGLASAYAGVDGLTTGWFLPSKDELNAMCNYSRNPTAPAAPSVSCYGSAPGTTQYGPFAAGAYGFASGLPYWSSSQINARDTRIQFLFSNGFQSNATKDSIPRVRPVRAF